MTDSRRIADGNAALIRRMMPDFDSNPVGAASKWMTPDFTTVMNGEPPMNLDAYREMAASVSKAFSDIRHEIHDLVAEEDCVALSMTLHLKHIGEYEGIAATGRTIRIAEMAVFHMREGKVASERVVVDFASLMQQLTAK